MQFSSVANCRVIEYFRLEGSLGGHLTQLAALCRVSYKIRPGCLELYPAGYWKPPKIRLHKLSGQPVSLLYCFMVKKLFLIPSLIPPYRYGKTALRSLWNLPSSRMSKPGSLSLSSQDKSSSSLGILVTLCWTCSSMLISLLYVGGGGEGRRNSRMQFNEEGVLLLIESPILQNSFINLPAAPRVNLCVVCILLKTTWHVCVYMHIVYSNLS